MTQEKKKVYRAGVIPYIIEDGKILMYCMKPSDETYGGNKFQIAKGKVEEGETDYNAALREAQEELGLFVGNVDGDVIELGTFLGRTTVYVAKIKEKDMFGLPHHETAETKWMTVEEFIDGGRTLHRPIIQAAARLITKIESKKETTDTDESSISLNEVLDYRPDNIKWEKENNILLGYFDVEGNEYRVFFEDGEYDGKHKQPYKYVNVGFDAIVNGTAIRNLQNWKSSPYKVLGGVIKAVSEQMENILAKYDFVLFGVADSNGSPEQRLKLYRFIANRYADAFLAMDTNIKTKYGTAVVLYNSKKVDQQQQTEIKELISRLNLK